MQEPKPAYKMTIKLDGAKPERIVEAMTTLRDIASDYDQTTEASGTIVFESLREEHLHTILAVFESWMLEHAPYMGNAVDWKRPVIRPETLERRAREQGVTPMDRMLDSVTLSHKGRSVTLDTTTARNAAEMLRNDSALFEDEDA